MHASLYLVTAAILLGVSWFAWTHRSYWEELRHTVHAQRHTPVKATWTDQRSDDLGYYYWLESSDFSADISEAEREALATDWVPPVAYGASDHPVAIAQDGLRNFNRYVAAKDDRFLELAVSAGDLLVTLQQANGSWRYSFDFNDLKAGWTSAMAQGQAISLLLRLYQTTARDEYLASSERAYQYMLMPVEQGGTNARYPDGAPILEEYPESAFSPYTLNGAIFALWGVRDYALVTGSPQAAALFDEYSQALADHLALYDTGDWTFYSLNPENPIVATPGYHGVHIAQARAMAEITGDERWAAAAQRWQGYADARARTPVLKIWWGDTLRRFSELNSRVR